MTSTIGKDREGNATRLREIGLELGYTVEVVSALSDESGVISSTEIRKLIADRKRRGSGALDGSSLFPAWTCGGRRRARQNNRCAYRKYWIFSRQMIPANGIYACWAYLKDRKILALQSISAFNPTFTPEKQTANVEAHLLDFKREIYGEDVCLEFVERLRDELKFNSVDALLEQIWKDIEDTRKILSDSG